MIGSDFGEYYNRHSSTIANASADASFVDWLFAEAAKGAPASEAPVTAEPSSSAPPPVRDEPPHQSLDSQRRPSSSLRATAPIYQSALAQALPSTSPSAQKRTASARSPSPSGPPTKSRRTDLPTGPRAMFRDGSGHHGPSGGPRSLLDRVGPARGGHGGPYNQHDDVQARIDSITNGSGDPNMMMMNGGFPMNGMPGMDMGAMNMANPMMLQEMMMSQMAMMSQLAGAMGILPQAQFMNGGMPMQPGMGGDMGGFNGLQGGMAHGGPDGGRGRGRGRGAGRGAGRGRGGHNGHHSSEAPSSNGAHAPGTTSHTPAPAPAAAPVVAAPTPIAASTSTGSTRPGFVAPERPQSPTLCKFGLKCTNPLCRYSHPSPVATPESGVVLSNDPCEKGKDCKDKDCIKAHVSPAVLNPNGKSHYHQIHTPCSFSFAAEVPKPNPFVAPAPVVQQNAVPCRFGAACTRPGCIFSHPARQQAGHFATPCRFGAACTRASCPFQHPEGRVLPTTFHRGLAPSGGLVNVPTPETGSIGAPSPHKSVSFKKADGANGNGGEVDAAKAGAATPSASSSAADLEKKVKEMEERKNEAQKAIAAAQAGKKDDASKAVPISA